MIQIWNLSQTQFTFQGTYQLDEGKEALSMAQTSVSPGPVLYD